MPILERSVAHLYRTPEKKYRFSTRASMSALPEPDTMTALMEPETVPAFPEPEEDVMSESSAGFDQAVPTIGEVFRLYLEALDKGKLELQSAEERKESRERGLFEARELDRVADLQEGSRV